MSVEFGTTMSGLFRRRTSRIVPDPAACQFRESGSGESRTGMANDQVCSLVLLLQTWLEPPDLDAAPVPELARPDVSLLGKPRGLKVRVAALDGDGGVLLCAEGVEHGGGQGLADEVVEARRADGHKGMHA